MNTRTTIAAIFAAAALVIPAAARPFTFTTIADSSQFAPDPSGSPGFGGIDVNNLGQVSFITSWQEGDDVTFRSDGVSRTIIADEGA